MLPTRCTLSGIICGLVIAASLIVSIPRIVDVAETNLRFGVARSAAGFLILSPDDQLLDKLMDGQRNRHDAFSSQVGCVEPAHREQAHLS
jgi:hypothetical protein